MGTLLVLVGILPGCRSAPAERTGEVAPVRMAESETRGEWTARRCVDDPQALTRGAQACHFVTASPLGALEARYPNAGNYRRAAREMFPTHGTHARTFTVTGARGEVAFTVHTDSLGILDDGERPGFTAAYTTPAAPLVAVDQRWTPRDSTTARRLVAQVEEGLTAIGARLVGCGLDTATVMRLGFNANARWITSGDVLTLVLQIDSLATRDTVAYRVTFRRARSSTNTGERLQPPPCVTPSRAPIAPMVAAAASSYDAPHRVAARRRQLSRDCVFTRRLGPEPAVCKGVPNLDSLEMAEPPASPPPVP
ncbi:MAG: hypothetical protein MUF21_14100 [Gemmatimonadaceae bacterium]|jgi:hypothetical protein|nr:hypothetical protein [Gemmatimonadaceae bacterium]